MGMHYLLHLICDHFIKLSCNYEELLCSLFYRYYIIINYVLSHSLNNN